MTEQIKIVAGKRLRKGYTTGSCAAGAVKAAIVMLVAQQASPEVTIDTPAGIRLTLPVTDSWIGSAQARCAVIKDGGDDPDVTHGLKIVAEVCWAGEGITILGGAGVGVVTEPGLKVPIGQPAINPVPMQMIRQAIKEVLPVGTGVTVTISVPGGEALARRTFNPKLGIVGGISILGTTGIVEPMSEEALKDSLALQLSMMRAKGLNRVVLVFGNYGERYARIHLGIATQYIVKVGNFVGFMLEQAQTVGFEQILLVGHLGKLVKVAAGIFQTHSRVADARIEILCAYAALAGAALPVLQAIERCKTTEAVVALLEQYRLNEVYQRVVANVARRCMEFTHGTVTIGSVLFHGEATLLAQDATGAKLIGDMQR